ncbi:MAG: hypothetical protein STSR0008_08900 [Ignavibacterium sp.]
MKKFIPDKINQYLQTRTILPSGEILKKYKLESNINYETTKIKYAIVIPAICEYENIKRLINNFLEIDSKYFSETILIFVINSKLNPFVFNEEEIQKDNQLSLTLLKEIISKQKSNYELIQKAIDSKLNFGLIDCSSKGKEFSSKEGGVGLARKVGMDLALTVFDYNSYAKNLIICLDADCMIEKNYLTTIVDEFNNKNFNVAILDFEHPLNNDDKNLQAIICYEIFLRYYVLGLTIAISPYAFHTVGSTIICNDESYIKVGGMNKRQAGEDFYFLEKLAKVESINKIKTTKVFPSSRESMRVPFGTGQRITRFNLKMQNEFVLYNPNSFFVLKDWLNIFSAHSILSLKEYLKKAKEINLHLHNFLIEQNFEESWNKILINSKTEIQIQNQKKFWFDGFRTFKLIHYLRDNCFSNVNMFQALDEIFFYLNLNSIKKEGNTFVNDEKIIPSIKTQIEYLKMLRKIT